MARCPVTSYKTTNYYYYKNVKQQNPQNINVESSPLIWSERRVALFGRILSTAEFNIEKVHSFFFSFCLRSFWISFLTIPTYLVRIPCWFKPGSKRRTLTIK